MGSPLYAEASKWVSRVLKLANDHIWRSWKVGHEAYIQKGRMHHGESFADTKAQGRSVQQTIAFYSVILESRWVMCGLNLKNVLKYFVKRRLPSFQWCGFSSLLLSETDTGRGRMTSWSSSISTVGRMRSNKEKWKFCWSEVFTSPSLCSVLFWWCSVYICIWWNWDCDFGETILPKIR